VVFKTDLSKFRNHYNLQIMAAGRVLADPQLRAAKDLNHRRNKKPYILQISCLIKSDTRRLWDRNVIGGLSYIYRVSQEERT